MSCAESIALPPPRTVGAQSFEEVLLRRHSVRDFVRSPIPLAHVAQLLWAAQGITHSDGLRAAPSAGALYPLELYLLAADVQELAAGVYRYIPHRHRIELIRAGDFRAELVAAALYQDWLQDSAAVVGFVAVEARTTAKYGARGTRYVQLEAGHAAQSVLLQAFALGLCGTPVGAFDDALAARLLNLCGDKEVLYLVPIGTGR